MTLDPDFERELVCTRCRRKVIVAELPERHLDALGYVCGTCQEKGKPSEAAQPPVVEVGQG